MSAELCTVWTVVGASVLFLPRPMARDSNFRLPITNFQKVSSNFYISVLTYPRFTVMIIDQHSGWM